MMRFKRLTSTDDPFFKEGMSLYNASFPLHEQSCGDVLSHHAR